MKRRLAIIICIAMVFTLIPTFAMASDGANAKSKNVKKAQTERLTTAAPAAQLKAKGNNNVSDRNEAIDKSLQGLKKSIEWDTSWVSVYRPEWNEVIYQGEVLYTDYRQYDTWEDWYTIPVEVVWDANDEIVYYEEFSGSFVDVDDYADWYGTSNIKSKKLPPGRYTFMVLNAPADEYGYTPDGWVDDFEVPYDYSEFVIKKFKAPTNVKATAGKKKVTVSFKKSAGATKYKIYRSTKKNSSYKLVKTTTKNKFVDKKVKKGKRYYYKVKAIRKAAKKNEITSKFSTPKRSKKVK